MLGERSPLPDRAAILGLGGRGGGRKESPSSAKPSPSPPPSFLYLKVLPPYQVPALPFKSFSLINSCSCPFSGCHHDYILQRRKLRLRETKSFTQGHTAISV